MASKNVGPMQSGFYNRPSAEIYKELLGERLLTPAEVVCIQQTEGFNGLIRASMIEDHSRIAGKKKGEPGNICITNFRGWPQINVMGESSRGDKPQLTWIKEMGYQGVKVSGVNLIKEIAKTVDDTELENDEVMDYAIAHIEGQNVQDPKSLIRIIPNLDMPPLGQRKMAVEPHGGKAANSVGVGSITPVDGCVVTSEEQIKLIVTQEAARLGLSAKHMLDAGNLKRTFQRSPIIKRLIGHLANQNS